MNRRTLIHGAAFAAGSALALPYYARKAHGQERNLLIVNTWGGAYTDAERRHYFDPFTRETGIRVEIDTPVSFAKLRTQVDTRNYTFDVSSLNAATISQARNQGLLEPLDWDIVDRTGTKNIFFENFGVGANVLSTTLVYRTDKFPNGGPANWQDFFDVSRFPGARSMGRRAYTTLAFAMLGSGAPRDRIYPIDIDRALAALGRIRPSVRTWWEHGNESEELLRKGEVDMMSIWNQRPVRLIRDGVPVKIVWEGAEHVNAYYYMAKGAPRKRAAMQFLNFISRPEVQAAFAAETFYAPTNPDAIPLVSAEAQPFMSTRPEHLAVGFHPDANWLGENISGIERRFIAWLAQGR